MTYARYGWSYCKNGVFCEKCKKCFRPLDLKFNDGDDSDKIVNSVLKFCNLFDFIGV